MSGSDRMLYDEAVHALYSAAAGLLSWQVPLLAVARLFGARVASLHRSDPVSKRLLEHHAGHVEPLGDGMLHYLRSYHAQDPRLQLLREHGQRSPGQWLHDHEHLDAESFEASDFYQHFLAAYGCRYLSGLLLRPIDGQLYRASGEQSNGSSNGTFGGHEVSFGIEFGPLRGPLNTAERELLQRWGQHLVHALQLHERLHQQQAHASLSEVLLQDFAQPMFLLGLDQQLQFANAAALDELRSGRVLGQSGGFLVAVLPILQQQWPALWSSLPAQAHATSSAFSCSLGKGKLPLVLHFSLLLPQQVAGAVFGALPQVLLSLFDAARVPAADPFALASLLRLTPGQARVAALLAQGQSAEEVSVSSGIRISTVRTHLHHILARLGLQRSSELVRLLSDGHALWGLVPQPAMHR